jgi:pyrrolidone-carboxylate peptidase
MGALSLPLTAFGRVDQTEMQSTDPMIQKATDFSTVGNDEVFDRYQSYLKKPRRCEFSGKGKRVLLTGFGLFSGVPYNISGALIENFMNPQVWPEVIDTSHAAPAVPSSLKVAHGILGKNESGSRITHREIKIDQKTYEVCFVMVDVLWDFAGAVIASEMERLQPDLVIMTGRGDDRLILESAARNSAAPLPGFYSNGNAASENTPVSKTIDTKESDELIVPMTWNNQALHQRIAPLVQELGFESYAPNAWRPGNNYICNNLSFITLLAAEGGVFQLAGGSLTVSSHLNKAPQVGFMHLPAHAEVSKESLPQWVRLYASLIDEALK